MQTTLKQKHVVKVRFDPEHESRATIRTRLRRMGWTVTFEDEATVVAEKDVEYYDGARAETAQSIQESLTK